MPDVISVIKGLQEAVDWLSTETSITVVDQWVVRDALALLKAQEPRVMTWEELKEWHRTDPVKREPIFIEYADEGICGKSRWYITPFGLGALDDGSKRHYNKNVRCWTSRPTDEQREAVKWNA